MTPAARCRLYERLAQRFYARVYSYLRWLCADADLAEDLTQDTFIQIWRHPPELRGEQALKAWVYRVARNEYLQHHRRSGLQTVALDDCVDTAESNWTAAQPQSQYERQARSIALHAAIERLPAVYREVVVLHYVDDLSLSHVAQVLGVPEGTAKSRCAKALALLRSMFAAEVVQDGMR